ncbi:MAG: outer membrane beta-barrel protein [Bacteroidales bacterium]|nr:outer membrane beta-barrel protein [Bacteroidales bacterium]
MKNCKKHLIVALIVLTMGQFLAPLTAHSQVLEVGGSVGLSYYMGDINPKKPFVDSNLGWGVLVRYYEGTRWAFRLAYSNLQLNGSDKSSGYRPERGLSFNTNAHDIALVAEFNFFDYFTGSKRNGLSPYIFGGLSGFYFNPKADDGKELCSVLTDVDYDKGTISGSDAKYNKFALSIPFGVGVKYSVAKRLGVALEWRWDYTFTDWIDDCHAYYPTYESGKEFVQYADPTGFAADDNGNNTNEYIQRGNKADNDWFGYLNFSLTYKFNLPNGNDCNKRERYKNFD